MKFIKQNLILITLICVIGCKHSQRGLTNIELSFINDSTDKEECFADFYKSKLKSFNRDTLINRFSFPFTYAATIKGTDDWQTLKFTNRREVTSSDKFENLMSSIFQEIKFDKRFDKIFATKSQLERSLKVSVINKSNRFIYVHFITDNGKWFIKSFQEVPVFEDGGIPVEDD